MENTPDSTLLDDTPNVMNLIVDYLGWGRFQWTVIFFIGIINMVEGTEVTVLTILAASLEAEWGLDTFQSSFMIGIIFAGQMVGSLTAGIWGDDVGRMTLLKVSSVILLIFGLSSALMPEFWSFAVMRGLTGVGLGFIGVLSMTYSSETAPHNLRGFKMIGTSVFYYFGQILIAVFALALNRDMDPAYWRTLLFIAIVPILVFLPFVFCYAVESPYFLAIHERYDEAVFSLNTIARMNRAPEITDEERELLKSVPFKSESVGFDKVSLMFEEDKLRSTVLLVLLWFFGIFAYYGMFFIVPKTIGMHNSNFMVLCILVIGVVQVPSQFVAVYAIEIKCIGRKHTLSLSLLGQTLSALVSMFLIGSPMFLVSIALYFSFCSIWFTVVFVYTAELFETRIRTMAVCFCNIFGNFGAVIAPGIVFAMHDESGKTAPYILIVVISAVNTAICLLLPFETMSKGLDTKSH
jgi:MFS family permease